MTGAGATHPRSLRRLVVRLVCCVLLAVCFWSALPAGAQGSLRAGVGGSEITPPAGTPLGGYGDRKGRPSTGVHDRLYAKALVLHDGKTEVAIVTTDLIGTNPEIRREVCKKTGFPPDRLLLCASHTHSGPGAFGKGLFAEAVLGKYDQKIFDLLVDRISSAVDKARKDLQPARVGTSSAPLEAYVRNRRKGSTITIPDLTVVRVDRRRDGKPLAALFHYTAHGTVLGGDNMLASADWMGVSQAAVEKALPGVTALYVNGAEGDQSPSGHDDRRGFERSEAIGSAVAEKVVRLFRGISPSTAPSLQVLTAEVPLPQTLGGALLGAGKTVMVQAVAIGDVLLLAVPGEMIAELGIRLVNRAKQRGWRLPLVVGLANDHLGYLLTEAEYRKGGYEATVSFFGPKFGEVLTAAIETLLIDRLPAPGVKQRESVSLPAGDAL